MKVISTLASVKSNNTIEGNLSLFTGVEIANQIKLLDEYLVACVIVIKLCS